MIIKTIDIDTLHQKEKPLWFHERGLMQTATGYGRRLKSSKMVMYNRVWRRVIICQYSNAGTAYIEVKGNGRTKDWIVLN